MRLWEITVFAEDDQRLKVETMAEFRVFSGHEQPFLLQPTSQVPPYPEDPYGIEGMKYIVQIYEGEVNGHGERE